MNLIKRGWNGKPIRPLNPGDILVGENGILRFIVGRTKDFYLYKYDLDADEDHIYDTQGNEDLVDWVEVNNPTPDDIKWLKERRDLLMQLYNGAELSGTKFVIPPEWKLPGGWYGNNY